MSRRVRKLSLTFKSLFSNGESLSNTEVKDNSRYTNMEDEKLKTYVEARQRLALRENEGELRQFERDLRNALILKEQICQMREKRHRNVVAETRSRRESDATNNRVLQENQHVEKELNLNVSHKTSYKEMLLLQIDMQKEKEMMKRKEILDEMDNLKKIEESHLEESRIDKENKNASNEELQHLVQVYKKSKEIEHQKIKIFELEQERKRLEYQAQQTDRKVQLLVNFEKKKKEREQVVDRMVTNLMTQENMDKERKSVIELMQQLRSRISQQENDEQHDADTTMKKTMLHFFRDNIGFYEDSIKDLKERETLYKKQILELAKEEEQFKQENMAMYNFLRDNYRFDIELQIEMNKTKLLTHADSLRNADGYVRSFNEQRRKQIEEEKAALLREYNVK